MSSIQKPSKYVRRAEPPVVHIPQKTCDRKMALPVQNAKIGIHSTQNHNLPVGVKSVQIESRRNEDTMKTRWKFASTGESHSPPGRRRKESTMEPW